MGNQSSRVAATMSTGAAIMAALAWLKSGKAEAAPPGTIPEELMQLVIAIAGSAQKVDENTLAIISAIESLALKGGLGWPPNAPGIQTVRVICALAATAYQLPDMAIPSGMQLTIKAWPLNGNLIFVAENQSAATNMNRIHALAASEQVFYQVQNANSIYVAAVVATESVTITSEKGQVV